MHKTKHAKITTSYKNNNEGLPKRYYCIKILPERWSVPKSHSSGNRPQSRQPESLFAPHEKGERFYHEEEITCYADDWRYGCKPCSLRRRFFYPAGGDTQKDGGENAGTTSGCSVDVILKTTASEYWSYVKAGAEAYSKDNPDVQVEVKGATSETAYDEQQNMIETDLNSGAYDAFVIAPLQADLVKTLIAGKTDPIIAVDTNIDAPEVLSFVGTGNEDAAAMGGKEAVKAAQDAGWSDIKAIAISGVQGDGTLWLVCPVMRRALPSWRRVPEGRDPVR